MSDTFSYPVNKFTVAEFEEFKRQHLEAETAKQGTGLLVFSADEWAKHHKEISVNLPTVVVYNPTDPPSFDILVECTDFWYQDLVENYSTAAAVAQSLQHLMGKPWFTHEHCKQLVNLLTKHRPRKFRQNLA